MAGLRECGVALSSITATQGGIPDTPLTLGCNLSRHRQITLERDRDCAHIGLTVENQLVLPPNSNGMISSLDRWFCGFGSVPSQKDVLFDIPNV